MNTKPTRLFQALSALALVCVGHAAHAADNPCAFINENRTQIEQALFQHYGNSDRLVKLGHNNGDFDFMRLRGGGFITAVSGCSIKFKAPAQKVTLARDVVVGVAAGHPERTRDGEVEWQIGFDATRAAQLCVQSQSVKSANWRKEGQVKENIFVRNNRHKNYFNGCLL